MQIVALIPARAGSKRIPSKNTKLLGGKPLIQWTIEAAKASGLFNGIVVCTDDEAVRALAHELDFVYCWRDPVPDEQPDIEWVREALAQTIYAHDAFAILRPTSPFRTADTIVRAVGHFQTTKCSSIRAVERVRQHPGKMWGMTVCESEMRPLLGEAWGAHCGVPSHSQPTQMLPDVYIQNSSLEIAHRWCVDVLDSISGPKVAPFFTEGYEGFAIDYPEDWDRAEQIVAALQAPPAA